MQHMQAGQAKKQTVILQRNKSDEKANNEEEKLPSPTINKSKSITPFDNLESNEQQQQQSSVSESEEPSSDEQQAPPAKKSKRATLIKPRTVKYEFKEKLEISEDEPEIMPRYNLNHLKVHATESLQSLNEIEDPVTRPGVSKIIVMSKGEVEGKKKLSLKLNLNFDLDEFQEEIDDYHKDTLAHSTVWSDHELSELSPIRSNRSRLMSATVSGPSRDSKISLTDKKKGMRRGHENWDELITFQTPTDPTHEQIDDDQPVRSHFRSISAKSPSRFTFNTPTPRTPRKSDKYYTSKLDFNNGEAPSPKPHPLHRGLSTGQEILKSIIYEEGHHDHSDGEECKTAKDEIKKGGEEMKVSRSQHWLFAASSPKAQKKEKRIEDQIQEIYQVLKTLKAEIDDKRQIIKMCEVIKDIGKFVTSQEFYSKSNLNYLALGL